MWKYRAPIRSDYDDDDEFNEATDAYWDAVDDYCSMCEDERY